MATAGNASQPPGRGAGKHLARAQLRIAELAFTREAEPGKEEDSVEIASPAQSLGSSPGLLSH